MWESLIKEELDSTFVHQSWVIVGVSMFLKEKFYSLLNDAWLVPAVANLPESASSFLCSVFSMFLSFEKHMITTCSLSVWQKHLKFSADDPPEIFLEHVCHSCVMWKF